MSEGYRLRLVLAQTNCPTTTGPLQD